MCESDFEYDYVSYGYYDSDDDYYYSLVYIHFLISFYYFNFL